MDRANGAGRRVLAGAFGLIAIATLSGCAEFEEATHLTPLSVNPASPVAADVERAELARGTVPSFRSVPPKPTDVPAPAAYKGQVVTLVGDRRALNQWDKANPPGVSDDKATEAYAKAQRQLLAGQTPAPQDQEAQSEAFAKKKVSEAQSPQDKAAAKKPAPVATSPY